MLIDTTVIKRKNICNQYYRSNTLKQDNKTTNSSLFNEETTMK